MFERLGLCLRTFRELSGKSQASVAREAGIGKSQLSKYENGKELPKLDSLGKVLCGPRNLAPDFLLWYRRPREGIRSEP